MKLIKIVTHDKKPEEAAELFANEGIVAIGWADFGDLRKLTKEEIKEKSKNISKRTKHQSAKDASQLIMFRDQVKHGDFILAYKGRNKVALVGEVVSDYKFKDKNKVGSSKGEIGYPNQRKVKWWDRPRNFDRSFLPKELVEWVAIPGTIAIREYNIKKLKENLQKIPSGEVVTKALEIQGEDEIKEYIENHPADVEQGLLIVKREYPTSTGPMDFLVRDKNGIHTVIEVKLNADDTTVMQIRRYIRSYKHDSGSTKVRGIIVAKEFSKRCIDEVEELKSLGFDLRIYRCNKRFDFFEYLVKA